MYRHRETIPIVAAGAVVAAAGAVAGAVAAAATRAMHWKLPSRRATDANRS